MFLCCQSGPSPSKREAIEAEARRARIVSILPSPSPYGSGGVAYSPPLHRRLDPPPRYEDATQDAPIPYTSDEKHSSDRAAQQQQQQQQQQHQNPLSPARIPRPDTPSSSDEDSRSVMSSIVSIPSTQVTGITMAHTGTGTTTNTIIRRDLTGLTNASASSRPPSYSVDDGGNSREMTPARTASPASSSSLSDGTGRILRHPVMGQDWRDWVDGMIASRSRDALTRSR